MLCWVLLRCHKPTLCHMLVRLYGYLRCCLTCHFRPCIVSDLHGRWLEQLCVLYGSFRICSCQCSMPNLFAHVSTSHFGASVLCVYVFAGTSNCDTCASSSTCSLCTTGYGLASGTCSQCISPQRSNGANACHSCTNCATGNTCDDGTECTLCNAGYFYDSSAHKCNPCKLTVSFFFPHGFCFRLYRHDAC
jgi:hypothetical protein